MAQTVKNPPAMQETWVQFPSWEDPLEEVMATHSSILAWRIPLVCYSPWGHKESDMTEQLSTHIYTQYILVHIVLSIYMGKFKDYALFFCLKYCKEN